VEGSRPVEEIVRPADGLIAVVDGLDFEDLEAALSTIKIAVDHAGEEEAIIDITGGQKPNTAAAVLFTVKRKTRAQYVQTNIPKGVVSYDIVTEPVPSV
jgi:succinyl-CoA synthetase beta subunit